MTIKRKMVLPLALALGALGLMLVAQMASATHPRPKGATPLRVSLVPTYKPCAPGVANEQHGAPLAGLSCKPTVQDLTFPVTESCANSPPNPVGPTVGSTCNVSTTANGVVPSSVQDSKRANVEVQTINVNDGGSSGAAGAPDATIFMSQGIFIP